MIETKKFWNFNPAKGHDKVYLVTLMAAPEGKFDVVGQYGRRNGKLAFHIHAEGVGEKEARQAFDQSCRTRLKHEYKEFALDQDLDALAKEDA